MPTQATLEGIPPVQTPANEAALRVAIIGQLLRPPRVRVATSGDVFIDAVIQQHVPGHEQAKPLQVIYHEHEHGEAGRAIAAARCRSMEATDWAMVLGRGVEIGYLDGAPCLRLITCHALDACNPPIDPETQDA